MNTEIKTKQNTIKSITLWSLIGLLIFFIIMVLYIPKLSNKIIGVAAYQNLTGYDSTLDPYDLLFVKDKPFEDLKPGDMILFDLEGHGDIDGLKVYKIMVQPDEDYYHVHSTDNQMSFPWNITEEMYVGIIASKIPYVGAITGFLGSFYGIAVLVVNGLIIGAIVYLVKENKKDKQQNEKKETEEGS